MTDEGHSGRHDSVPGDSSPTTLFCRRTAELRLSDASECWCSYSQLTPQNQNISCSSHMQLLPVAQCAEEKMKKKKKKEEKYHTFAHKWQVLVQQILDVETLQVRTRNSTDMELPPISFIVIEVRWVDFCLFIQCNVIIQCTDMVFVLLLLLVDFVIFCLFSFKRIRLLSEHFSVNESK